MKTILKTCCCLLLVGLLAGMNACQKENPIEPTLNGEFQITDSNTEIRVVDGRLAFDSMEGFNKTKEALKQAQDELENWEGQFSGFTSMRMAFERLTLEESESMVERIEDYPFATIIEVDGEKYFESPIQNPVIKSMVNEESLIQIGSDIYKFTYNNMFKTSVENLIDLKKATDAKVPRTVTKEEIIRSTQNLSNSRGRFTVGRCQIDYNAINDFKLKGIIQRENLVLNDGDCIISARHYRRNSITGIYFFNRIPYMYLHVKGPFMLIWHKCGANNPYKWNKRRKSAGNVSEISVVVSRNDISNTCNSGAVTPLHGSDFWSEYHGSTHDGNYQICNILCPLNQGCDY